MAFSTPITGGDDFRGRFVQLDDPPMHGFVASVGTDYSGATESRFVNVATSGLYTFTFVGGETGVQLYLLAGYNHKMRVSKVESAAGTVVFLY